jgi:hypothetical protein
MRNFAFCLWTLMLMSLPTMLCASAHPEARLKSPRIVAQTSETVNSETGEIPLTILITPEKSRLYRVSYYWIQTSPTLPLCNPADCLGQLSLIFHWTDDAGVQTSNFLNGSLQSIFYSFSPFTFQQAAPVEGQIVVRVDAGTPLQYEFAGTTGETGNSEGATYEFFFTVEQLQ